MVQEKPWVRALKSAGKIAVVGALGALIAGAQSFVPDGVAFVVTTAILKFVLKYVETNL